MAPRPFTQRMGLKLFQISEEDYLHPDKLLDSVLDDVVSEGVFIARLDTWTEEDGKANIRTVKDFVERDQTLELFHPDWLKRKTIIEKCAYYISPCHEQTVEKRDTQKLCRMQRSIQKKVKECTFQENTTKSELEEALEMGVETCLDTLLETLEDKTKDILYLQNVHLCNYLNTTESVSMKAMATNLENLNGGGTIVGINVPTIYMGFPFATFNCHREDMAFAAVNRHIAGSAKIWFCIPPRYHNSFLTFVRSLPIYEALKPLQCFIQHKLFWMDPRRVMQANIPVSFIVQKPGDIIFLLPNTIHWGFNVGENINEAMNLVSKSWAMPGMMALQRCNCSPEWNANFDLTETLKKLGVDQLDIKNWKLQSTSDISMRLRKEKPLLHPDHCTPGSETVNKGNLLPTQEKGDDQGLDEAARGQMDKEGQGFPRCLICKPVYCPGKYGEAAFTRLENHSKRKHPKETETMMEKIRNMWSREKRMKNFKGKKMECDICGTTLHGKMQNLLQHQESCKR